MFLLLLLLFSIKPDVKFVNSFLDLRAIEHIYIVDFSHFLP